jgi:conjugal transfer ATP-binding protein TraC
LSEYRFLRDGKTTDPRMLNAVAERTKFMRDHTKEDIVTTTRRGAIYRNGFIFDLQLLVSVVVPISGSEPTVDEITSAKSLMTTIKSALNTLEMNPMVVNAEGYLRFIHPLVNWSRNAGWTNHTTQLWDKNIPLANQIFDYDNDVFDTSEDLNLGDYAYCRVLSAKQMPEYYYFGSAIHYAGSLDGSDGDNQYPYAICCNLYFPNRENLKSKIVRKRQFTVNQAYGPIAKFSPELIDKKESFDILDASLRNGAKPLMMSYSALVFGKSKTEAQVNAQNFADTWRERGFTMLVDKFVQIPLFCECLPMNSDKSTVQMLYRYKTMTTEQAAVMIPIFGEWKGTGTPHLLMSSRNGQIMSFSLHDTGSNKNAVIAAQSGSGKSFFINELITSYLSEGAQIWVIDAGKSYKKLCEDYEGDFLQFDESADIRMNPFELIANYEDEEDTLVSLLLNMASMKGNLEDIQVSGLKRVLNDLWKVYGNDLTLDYVSEELAKSDDQRLVDIGTQLYAFTSKAPWGKYFAHGNNVSFKNRFTVLELDELQGRKHLRQVVLLQLIMQIQHEVYLGDRGRKKIVIVDEAWDLLKEGEVARFMEGAYRKFRKYNGSVVIATQSIADLYDNPAGRAIAENSATMCLLGQKAEAIEGVKRNGQLQISEGMFQQLKSVHTIAGVFSEIFVRGEAGQGIFRLFVDDYSKLQYSTSPDDLAEIQKWRQQGLTNAEAIKKILEERRIAQGA